MAISSECKTPVVPTDDPARLCTCGNPHPAAGIELYYGRNAYGVLAEDCLKNPARLPVFLLDDENTREVAGEAIRRLFEKRSVKYNGITLPGDTEATERLAELIRDESLGCGFIVAVGSGTLNDLGKHAAAKRGIPYSTVPTAPSMNGYTSAIAAMKVGGVKCTLPSVPPQTVYADPGVIRSSPARLRQAGFCDLAAKFVADNDWQTESMLFNGSYCELPSAILSGIEESCMAHPEKIRAGDTEAVSELFRGLLVSGVAMTLAGSSAPASGGEHLISHFLDMREPITGRKPELHGLQVGLGVLVSASCYGKLSMLGPGDLKKNAESIHAKAAEGIPGTWGKYASEVEKKFQSKRNSLLALDHLLPANLEKLASIFGHVKSLEYFVDLFRRTGFELTLESLNLSSEEYFLAANCARTIRERITVLDIAAHAGVLEEAVAEVAGFLV